MDEKRNKGAIRSMIWSDEDFHRFKELLVTPFSKENVQPNSYELTLDDTIQIATETGWIEQKLPYVLPKGIFTLASSKEVVRIPHRAVGKVVGKSSIARLGLPIEFAGMIDTGFEGQITLELYNMAHPINLTEGMKIAQLMVEDAYPCSKKYGECNNHYQNQKGATKSWMNKL